MVRKNRMVPITVKEHRFISVVLFYIILASRGFEEREEEEERERREREREDGERARAAARTHFLGLNFILRRLRLEAYFYISKKNPTTVFVVEQKHSKKQKTQQKVLL
jgi:hypothetical protein